MSSRYRTYRIEKLHFRGDGLATDLESDSHRKIHIANALPGEKVLAVEPDFAESGDKTCRRRYACLIDVLESSPDRCLPACSQWRRCSACQYQCLNAGAQQRIKFENWLRLIQRSVELPENVEFKPALSQSGYRHRTDALIFHQTLGMMPRQDVQYLESENAATPDIRPVPLRECVLHAPELNRLMEKVEKCLKNCAFPDKCSMGLESNLLAGSESSERITVYCQPEWADSTRISAEKLWSLLGIPLVFQILPPKGSHVYPKPELYGNMPWYGYDMNHSGEILYAMKGAWTPVNPVNAHLIRDTLKEMVSAYAFDSVLELGCGCGTHTDIFRDHAREYVGIDASWPAIQSAQYNAARYQWQNVQFYTDTAEHYLDKRYYGGRRAEAILMHSNRLPYSQKVAQWCRRFGARHIFIVAPTAYALSQECRHFVELGFSVNRLVICDTLPMTYHQMGVVHLSLQ